MTILGNSIEIVKAMLNKLCYSNQTYGCMKWTWLRSFSVYLFSKLDSVKH